MAVYRAGGRAEFSLRPEVGSHIRAHGHIINETRSSN